MFSLKLFISVAEPVETVELARARSVVGARSCTLIFKVKPQPLYSHKKVTNHCNNYIYSLLFLLLKNYVIDESNGLAFRVLFSDGPVVKTGTFMDY